MWGNNGGSLASIFFDIACLEEIIVYHAHD